MFEEFPHIERLTDLEANLARDLLEVMRERDRLRDAIILARHEVDAVQRVALSADDILRRAQ